MLNIATWAQVGLCKTFTQSAGRSRNATWISVMTESSILCRDAAKFSGPEIISDSLKYSGNVCLGQKSPR